MVNFSVEYRYQLQGNHGLKRHACAEAVSEVPSGDYGVELPVKVWIDNEGPISMTENKSSSARVRHMDTRYWYMHQLQDLSRFTFFEQRTT